jgi:hypothetical protein
MEDEEEMYDRASRGLIVATRDLAITGRSCERYLDVQLIDQNGCDAFDFIGGELIDCLSQPGYSAPEAVRRVLAKWRRFWGQQPKALLTNEEIIGLYGEVWFLSLWLLPNVGNSAIHWWRGPFAARHDFEWERKSVEVKTTTSKRGHVHWINGLDQLAAPEEGYLFFFGLVLAEEAGALMTLPLLISNLLKQLNSDPEGLNHLENALARMGYSPVHDEEYSKLHFRVVDQALYAVRDEFPRVTRPDFPSRVLNGIEGMQYQINLTGYERLRLAGSPEQILGIFV